MGWVMYNHSTLSSVIWSLILPSHTWVKHPHPKQTHPKQTHPKHSKPKHSHPKHTHPNCDVCTNPQVPTRHLTHFTLFSCNDLTLPGNFLIWFLNFRIRFAVMFCCHFLAFYLDKVGNYEAIRSSSLKKREFVSCAYSICTRHSTSVWSWRVEPLLHCGYALCTDSKYYATHQPYN